MGIIRFFLAISVLITHSTPIFGVKMLNGDMAVTGFFIVSGFLMAFILETKYVGRTKQFAINRVLRIYPTYLVALAFAASFFYFIPNGHHNPWGQFNILIERNSLALLWLALIANLTLLGADWSRYLNYTDAGGVIFPNFFHRGEGHGAHNLLFVPQAWTLPLELAFYLLAPLIVRLRAGLIVALTLTVVLAGDLIQIVLIEHNIKFDSSAFFPLVIYYFLLGVLAYRLYSVLSSVIKVGSKWSFDFSLLSFIAAFFWVFFADQIRRSTGVNVEVFYVLFAIFLPGLFLFGQSSHLDTAIGEYSYPIYLFHYPIATTVDQWASADYQGLVTLALTVMISALYINFIDVRVQRLRSAIAKVKLGPTNGD